MGYMNHNIRMLASKNTKSYNNHSSINIQVGYSNHKIKMVTKQAKSYGTATLCQEGLCFSAETGLSLID
jgi:hypothetical protein